MQYLEAVSRSPEVSWYRLQGDYQGNVNRWVVSTPLTTEICNRPELCGIEFSTNLRKAVTTSLASAPFKGFLGSVPSTSLCSMNFLRGSLNFDLRSAIGEALGSNYHATCFMSSQRSRKQGRWVVKEDMYRKMTIPDGAILMVGDVVATGVTVNNGFEVIENYLKSKSSTISGIVFFTIGCHKLEKILEEVHQRFTRLFDGYRETHAVYMEGKLRLVDSSTKLMIGIQGTDLIKVNSPLSPEFELSQYDGLDAPLERCAIYDAGSRAFDVVEYLDDVVQYWEQVRLLARRGYTLVEALKERWPESDYTSRDHFNEVKRTLWRGIEDDFLEQLWRKYQSRWTRDFRKWASTREALECVCEDRLKTFVRVFAQAKGEEV